VRIETELQASGRMALARTLVGLTTESRAFPGNAIPRWVVPIVPLPTGAPPLSSSKHRHHQGSAPEFKSLGALGVTGFDRSLDVEIGRRRSAFDQC